MSNYSPVKDEALVIANTKRKVRPNNIIEVAEALERLVSYYGTMKEAGQRVDLSAEMVREFLTVLKLPSEVRKLIENRKIDKIDVVRKIAALSDSTQQIDVAKTLADLSSDDVRDILRLVKTTGITIQEAKRVVKEAKPKGFHIFMMDFEDDVFKLINRAAKLKGIRPAELVRNIVIHWLDHNSDEAK